MIITLLQGVFTVDTEEGLTLTEIAPGTGIQDVIEATGCEFQVSIMFTLAFLSPVSIQSLVGTFTGNSIRYGGPITKQGQKVFQYVGMS